VVTSDARRHWNAEELIDVAVANGPVAEPGSGHHYANTNYIVLGELIERVTGRPWYDEIHRRLLGPLGMRHTHYAGEAGAPPVGPGFAGEAGMFVDATTSMDASVGGAAGALQSTASDLMRFARALRDGGLLDAQRQLEMRSFVPAEPRGYVRHEYGLGFEKYVVNDVTIYGHAGTAPAHGAFVGFDDTGLAITVMVNVSNPASAPLMTLEAVGAITRRDVSPPADTSSPAAAP
jgi:D-alanyl-D-alanine carboxypeptidase